jgi:hypothetical protein
MVQYNVQWLVPYNVCRKGQHSPQQQSCSHQALRAATAAHQAASPAPPPALTAAAARVSMLMQYRLPWTQHMCTCRVDGASIGVALPWCRLRREREAVRWSSTTYNGWCRTMCAGRVSTHPSSRAVATRPSERQQRPTRLPPQPPLLHRLRQRHVSVLSKQRTTACAEHTTCIQSEQAAPVLGQHSHAWCRLGGG